MALKVEIIPSRPTGQPSLKLPPSFDVHTGVTLQKTLQILAPLASSLEVLKLGGNKLGGSSPADVAVFTNLKELGMSDMDLEGKIANTHLANGCIFATLKR